MFELILLKLKEQYCRLTGKDPMEYQLEKYRLCGANIGEGVRAFSPITSAESYLISVGDNTTISTGVQFITHDNAVIKCSDGTDLVGPISIGKNCFIGTNVILLPGVSIADNNIIGAGSLVTKSFSDEGIVIAGNPARKICTVEEYTKKNKERIFDFSEKSSTQKQDIILNHQDKWVGR